MKRRGRFVVVSVTGYAITPGGASTGSGMHTRWGVLDSGWCYREVPLPRYRFGERGRLAAEELAALLNAEDRAYLASLEETA